MVTTNERLTNVRNLLTGISTKELTAECVMLKRMIADQDWEEAERYLSKHLETMETLLSIKKGTATVSEKYGTVHGESIQLYEQGHPTDSEAFFLNRKESER